VEYFDVSGMEKRMAAMSGQSKQSVMFVVNELSFFFSHRLELALAAKTAGYLVSIATPPSPRTSELANLGIEHHTVELSRSGLNPFKELLIIGRLYRLFKQTQPTIVHLVTVKPIVYGGIAARLSGVKGQVAAVPGLGFVYSNPALRARMLRPILDVLYRIALGHPNAITIFQNTVDKRRFESLKLVDSQRTVLIRGSGVDLKAYTATQSMDRPAAEQVITLACRMLWDKGVGTFVAAAKAIKLKHPNARYRFILVGGADPSNPAAVSQSQLQLWHDTSVIEWLGHRTDMPQIFKMTDIVCLPSLYGEGVPKVLIEACACAKPIVAMDIPGSRECVENSVNGFLIPGGDQTKFNDAIETLLLDSQLRNKMGLAGRLRAERLFDVNEVAQTTVGIYNGLAQKVS
jgi:glycosyltransferase involved in cell wall biosynthesis